MMGKAVLGPRVFTMLKVLLVLRVLVPECFESDT